MKDSILNNFSFFHTMKQALSAKRLRKNTGPFNNFWAKKLNHSVSFWDQKLQDVVMFFSQKLHILRLFEFDLMLKSCFSTVIGVAQLINKVTINMSEFSPKQ